MKTIPLDNVFYITVIPRFYDFAEITVKITDEETKIEYLPPNSGVNLSNGYLKIEDINIGFTPSEGQSFKIVITNIDNRIIYRGKLFATNLGKQNYKTTDDTRI